MSNPEKGSAEWFEQKKQARADLHMRLSLGLPHSNKPLGDKIIDLGKLGFNAPAASSGAKPQKPRKPRTPKAE